LANGKASSIVSKRGSDRNSSLVQSKPHWLLEASDVLSIKKKKEEYLSRHKVEIFLAQQIVL
jgi:hypothetical protein